MPYRKLAELPTPIRKHLPKHAQEIYISAFNNAWDQYADPDKRRDSATREETAHRVAWAAVEHKYQKREDGRWVRR